jgi:penicillin-binding protein 1A
MSRRERQRRRRRNKGGPGRIIFLSFGVLTALIAIAGLSAVGYVVSIASGGPDLESLKPIDQGSNSVVYAKDGTRLGVIQSDFLRLPIPSTSIPKIAVDATVAIEDRRFYQHKGVDFEGVIRAGVKNLQSGETVQGGSTLTMQLIRNLYTEDRERDFKRKIREAKLAEELENLHPGREGKKWILTKYMNSVPYGTVGGQEAYGIQAASRLYFNKRARQLTLSEAALLAGLPQAPSRFNPYLNPEGARSRRDDVLQAMADQGYISLSEAAEAQAKPLGVKRTKFFTQRREGYFFEYVRRELVRKYGIKRVRRGGLKVYTTVDLKLQQLARKAIKGRLPNPGDPAAAIVSINPKNGHIRAMASSRSFGESKFDLASQGKRQPGSTAKILVLMTAIRRGVDINRTSYNSHKLNFVDKATGIKIDVSNSDGGSYGGRRSLFSAVVASDNTVFQQLDLDLGPEAVRQTSYDMGITSKLEAYPAEALGGMRACCTVLEMARAYTTINNGGSRMKPIAVTKVRFPDGKIDTSLGRTQRRKVFTDGQTLEAIKAMEANVRGGTGTAAALGFCPVAGKTGTTTGFADAWFGGMTRNLTTMVWVGYPGSRVPMTSVPGWGTMFGGKAPAAIFHDFMEKAVDRKSCGEWPKPQEPFVGTPFFGTYARGGGAGTATGEGVENDGILSNDPPAAQNGEGTGQGGQQYPEQLYEAPPQTTPAPTPSTPGNNGNGNGNGNGGAGGVGLPPE